MQLDFLEIPGTTWCFPYKPLVKLKWNGLFSLLGTKIVWFNPLFRIVWMFGNYIQCRKSITGTVVLVWELFIAIPFTWLLTFCCFLSVQSFVADTILYEPVLSVILIQFFMIKYHLIPILFSRWSHYIIISFQQEINEHWF